jgi:hypothetical protein
VELVGIESNRDGIGARLIGIPGHSRMYRPLIVAGRWLQPGDGRVNVPLLSI